MRPLALALCLGALTLAAPALAVESDARERKRALVERFLAMPSVEEVLRRFEEQPYSAASLRTSYPWLTEAQAERAVAIFAEELALVAERADDALIEAYLDVFSEAEIRGLMRAYADPAFVLAMKRYPSFDQRYYEITGRAYEGANRRALLRMAREGLMDGLDEDEATAREFWDAVRRSRGEDATEPGRP